VNDRTSTFLTHLIRFAPAAALVGALGLATPASAEFEQQDYTLKLDGLALTDVEFDSADITVTGSLGYFFTDQLEGGIRQTLSYNDIGGSTYNGGTGFFVNYHFGQTGDRLQPFIGASLGYNYGDTTTDTFFAGPEGGVKYFVGDNSDWFVFGQVEYQFFFEDSSGADDAIDDGSFIFRLGLGVIL
jgi:outer membrane protein W